MRLVDANVLLYAVNTDAAHHERSRAWLDEALSGGDTVAFAWEPLLAFIRLSTRRGLLPQPLGPSQAMDVVDAWLSSPASVVLEPTPLHARIVRSLLEQRGLGANLVNDAHLAALAMEHGCTLVSYDRDFSRFDGLAWSEP